MYFKRLEILGFKSFADKTVLNFEPGITVIVGPNGCGKSNIFDSIRWVLGEQSVKSLRGSSMEDVIFNGTANKPGVGFAEVSCTFSNENKVFPIEYDEITITRRLFRSGESEYLLNKTQVRLKDILELLMGTGIGAESYSLIEQGKVDLIISSKPEDRRMIFDEASGITKFKSKKREALNKLEDTEDNLLRINDIIIEVKRQIGSIERQANKARRYKEEFEKLKDMEVKIALYELSNIKNQNQDLSQKNIILKEEEAKLSAETEVLNRKLDSLNSEMEKFKLELDKIKSQDMKLEGSIEMDGHQIELNKERITESQGRSVYVEAQKEEINKRQLSQSEKIEKLKLEIAGLSDFEKNTLNQVKEGNYSLESITSIVKNAGEEIIKSKKSILELTASHSKIKNEITEVLTQTQQILARKRRLEIEKTKVGSEKETLQTDLDIAAKNIEQVKSRVNLAASQKQEAANSLNSLQQKLKKIGEHIINLDKERVTLESQEQFVEDLTLQYQEMPDPVKGILLVSEPPNENITGILGRVKEVLPVEQKFHNLLENKLSQVNLSQMREVVCEAKFIELDSKRIARKIEEVISSIEKLKEEEKNVNCEIEAKNKQIVSLENNLHQEEISLSNQEMQKNSLIEQLNKLEAELELIGEELKESQESLCKINTKDSELKKQNESFEEQLRFAQNHISESQELINLKTKEKEEILVSLAQAETEIASLKEKEKSLHDNLRFLEETLSHDLRDIKQLEKEKEEISLRVEDLRKQNVELEKKINETTQQRTLLQSRCLEVDRIISEVIKVTKEEESKKITLQEGLQKINNNFHELRMQEQEFSFKEQGIKDRFIQTYKMNLEEVKDVSLEGVDFEILSKQQQELKNKVEAFGTVNLVAIEEYEELKKRFEFLNLQQADLLSAKEQLHSTIAKINRTTRELFLDTFNKVAEEFKTYFKLMFGGGEAQLILINPDDVLETGIEIIARPPGKKLQSISLLSGGEKTLTAVALIFGLFKVKPSPFCILDEIDAALDESNVGRFGYLLKDFVKTSQFIVITHNKKTIVNANVMYGITMQETGVSKIVSVKFSEKPEEKLKEENKESAVAVPA